MRVLRCVLTTIIHGQSLVLVRVRDRKPMLDASVKLMPFTDGHKRIMVEHTLHILVFPGLHPHAQQPPVNTLSSAGGLIPPSESSISLRDYVTMALPSSTRNRHPDISLWPPSPFHLVLPMITRLSFNEAGKITHHRDFWDVKVSIHKDPKLYAQSC